MKLKLTLLLVTTLLCASCTSPFPPGTVVTGQSGKNVVTADLSGLTAKQAAAQYGAQLAQLGVKLALDYITNRYFVAKPVKPATVVAITPSK